MSGREELDNVNPTIHGKLGERHILPTEEDDDVADAIDTREVFDILFCTRIYSSVPCVDFSVQCVCMACISHLTDN